MDTLLTTQQAAERLEISDSRIRQLILDGKLAAVKAGRDWLIKVSDLKLLEKRKTKPGPAPKAAGKVAHKKSGRTGIVKRRRSRE
jgi:excisionase family DNA binding protein